MRIALVTDSPSDLPQDLVEQHQIRVVPAFLNLGNRSYLDGIEINRSDFYTMLPNLKTHATTSAPTPAMLVECFENLFKQGYEHVIGIFTAEKLTSSYQNAFKAAETFQGKISVLDSGSVSMGIGYQVLEAARGIQLQASLPEILKQVKSIQQRVKAFAALDTFEYLRRSGRISHSVSALGSMLNIKPVVEMLDGVIRPVQVLRTTRASTMKLFSIISSLGPLEQLSILHTNAEARAIELLDILKENTPAILPGKTLLINATSVIGAHTGPGALGFAAVKQPNPSVES